MTKLIKVYDPVFGSNCQFFIGDGNRDVIVSMVKKQYNLKEDTWNGNNTAILDKSNLGACFYVSFDDCVVNSIWIGNVDDKSFETTMDHEIIHMVSNIYEQLGMKHCKENDECYAYMFGFIKSEVMKKLKPTTKVKKNVKHNSK